MMTLVRSKLLVNIVIVFIAHIFVFIHALI